MEAVSDKMKLCILIVNIYIIYKLTTSSTNDNDTTVRNTLFGAVTLTKNVDFDK